MSLEDFVGNWDMNFSRGAEPNVVNSKGTVDIQATDEGAITYETDSTDSEIENSGTGVYQSATDHIDFAGQNNDWEFTGKFELDENDKVEIPECAMDPIGGNHSRPTNLTGGPPSG